MIDPTNVGTIVFFCLPLTYFCFVEGDDPLPIDRPQENGAPDRATQREMKAEERRPGWDDAPLLKIIYNFSVPSRKTRQLFLFKRVTRRG